MIQAPPGYVPDPNNAGWYFDPTADIQQLTAWWQTPPEGFVEDPQTAGWYYDPNGDVNKKESWWRQPWVPDPEPDVSPALSFWSFEEIGMAANVQPYPNVSENWPVCVDAFTAWGIATPMVLIGLLGTMAKESGTLYPVRESYWLYNVDPAAAYRYYADTTKHAAYQGGPDWHGRGVIQATHQPTYVAFNDAMKANFGTDTGVDTVPDKMLEATNSANFAAWFFIQKGIVPLCESSNWNEVRRRVLGGYDADGIAKLRNAEAILLPLARARGLA